jgi:hypothetical protein
MNCMKKPEFGCKTTGKRAREAFELVVKNAKEGATSLFRSGSSEDYAELGRILERIIPLVDRSAKAGSMLVVVSLALNLILVQAEERSSDEKYAQNVHPEASRPDEGVARSIDLVSAMDSDAAAAAAPDSPRLSKRQRGLERVLTTLSERHKEMQATEAEKLKMAEKALDVLRQATIARERRADVDSKKFDLLFAYLEESRRQAEIDRKLMLAILSKLEQPET